MSLKVGIVGLGIMGGSFARNLLVDGHAVIGYDILEENIQAIVNLGGKAGGSPSDIAKQSDVVITSLPSIRAFHNVMTGENGITDTKKEGLKS